MNTDETSLINRVLINPNTGEILDTYGENDQITVRRKSQVDYVHHHIINFNSDKSFVKLYDEAIPLLERYLTMPEFKLAVCLIPHVSYEDCIIRRTKDRTSRILTISDIAELHGYKYDYAKKLIASLKSKGVVGRHETGSIIPVSDYVGQSRSIAYTVNPFIYFRGTDLLTPIHAFYENSGWKELLTKKSVS